MNNVQLYFAIGIPTFSVLIGIAIGIFQSIHVLNQINLRFTSLENRMTSLEAQMNGRMTGLESRLDARMSVIESDVKTIVRILGDLHSRVARLEERTAR